MLDSFLGLMTITATSKHIVETSLFTAFGHILLDLSNIVGYTQNRIHVLFDT